MTQVKICGIQTFAAAEAATTAKADYLGLVFIPESRRAIDFQVRQQIIDALWSLRRRPKTVALVADWPIKAIHNVYNGIIYSDAIQRCGAETPDYCRQAIAETGATLIQTHRHPPDRDPFQRLPPHLETLIKDYRQAGCPIILDCAADSQQGGSGQAFDWAIAAALAQKGHEFILAGGLNPENVAQAIAQVRPWGVDVSSGVETDGVKDPDKIRQFIANARAAA